MQHLNFQYFVWLFRRFATQLGVYGLLGVFMLMLVAIIFAKLIPMKNALPLLEAQLVQQNAMLTRKHDQPSITSTIPVVSETKQAADFYARFPDVSTLSEWLQAIDQAAIEQKLVLSHGDYKLNKVNKSNTSKSDSHLIRYEILLPVSGNYVQIRAFIAVILHDLPMLALSDFQIVREDVSSSIVEAKLLFTLFLKESS